MSKKISSSILHWLAVLAILMNVFAPSISHAVASNYSKHSVDFEICSAVGSKISQHLDFENRDQSSVAKKNHCPLCTLQTYYLPPINTVKFQFDFLDQSSLAYQNYQSPRIPFFWNISSPRAPPSQA